MEMPHPLIKKIHKMKIALTVFHPSSAGYYF